MPDAEIAVAIIAGLFGTGGIVAWYRAATERKTVISRAEQSAADVALACWKDLNTALTQRLAVVTERLAEVERQLETERERSRALEERSSSLERKIIALEQEREHWKAERESLLSRICELEGKS